MKNFDIFFILLLMPQVVLSTPSVQTVSPNIRSSFVGVYTIATTSYGTTLMVWNSTSYTLVYIKEVPTVTVNWIAILSFGEFSMDTSAGKIDLFNDLTKKERILVVISLSSSVANYINRLRIILCVAFDQYAMPPKFVTYSANSSPKRNITSSSNYTFTKIDATGLENNGTPKTFAYITGFNISSTGSNIAFDLNLEVLQLNSTSVRITFYSKSATPTYLESIKFVWMSFDPAVVNTPSFGQFDLYSRTLQPLSGSPSTTLSGSEMWEFNTMFGVTGLSISNSSSFSFNISVDVNTVTLSASSFNQLVIQVLVLQTFYCPYLTPYLLQPNDCYDVCPSRYQSDTTDLICVLCPYDCWSCNLDNECTNCSSIFDHRQLNTSSGRCEPVIGFYDDGYNKSEAQRCTSLCLTCINGFECLSCPTNYSLNNVSLCVSQNNTTLNTTTPTLDTSSSPPQKSTTTSLSNGSLPIAVGITVPIFFAVVLIIFLIVIYKRQMLCWKKKQQQYKGQERQQYKGQERQSPEKRKLDEYIQGPQGQIGSFIILKQPEQKSGQLNPNEQPLIQQMPKIKLPFDNKSASATGSEENSQYSGQANILSQPQNNLRPQANRQNVNQADIKPQIQATIRKGNSIWRRRKPGWKYQQRECLLCPKNSPRFNQPTYVLLQPSLACSHLQCLKQKAKSYYQDKNNQLSNLVKTSNSHLSTLQHTFFLYCKKCKTAFRQLNIAVYLSTSYQWNLELEQTTCEECLIPRN